MSELNIDILRLLVADSKLFRIMRLHLFNDPLPDCLSMTKALQLMGQTVEDLARFYSTDGADALVPVEALLKEISCPHKDYNVCELSATFLQGENTLLIPSNLFFFDITDFDKIRCIHCI